MSNKYYVYVYLDPLTCVPFYIGKGKNGRILDHLSEATGTRKTKGNKHKINKIRSIIKCGYKPIIYKIHENLSNKEATKLEIFFIKQIGRVDIGTGPLTNMTDGGDGTINKKVSEELKIKLSKLKSGVSLKDLHGGEKATKIRSKMGNKQGKNGMYGKKRSESEKQHLSETFKGYL